MYILFSRIWHKVRAQNELVEWMNEPVPRADAVSTHVSTPLNLHDAPEAGVPVPVVQEAAWRQCLRAREPGLNSGFSVCTSCVALGKSVNLSVPVSSYVKRG